MKKILLALSLCLLSINGFSWGQKGHDTVCAVAQRHLSKKARKAINELFEGRSMVYWANWLDDASNTPPYAYSKTWHYKNIDEGETYENALQNPKGDIVRALEAQIEILKSDTTSIEGKKLALKMVIHFLGDIHQPLHMGHRSDSGGNRWQVQFFNEGTNIHTVWDSKLVESAHKWTHTEWVEEIDRVDKDQIEAICQGMPNDWGKETYEICKQIYAETPVGSKLSYSYVSRWTPIIEQQLEKAGLRLAYVLNQIF